MTIEVFYDDPYQQNCESTVTSIEANGICLDRTIFYPTGGGQPGDVGIFTAPDGTEVQIKETIKSEGTILHLSDAIPSDLKVGDSIKGTIDWERRFLHMRYHTCLHLLCSIVPHGVTGGAMSVQKARLDFDMPEQNIDKEHVSNELNRLIEEDHPVEFQWITDEELQNKMDMVRTMSVKPPMGQGKVRLVNVTNVDLQPCGGTHLRSTGEIGKVRLGKVEKKGRQNRRVNIILED